MSRNNKAFFRGLYENNIVGEDFDVKIKNYLSLSEQAGFCNCVLNQVFTDNGYVAAFFDFAVKYATIIYYTNVGDLELNDPELSEKFNNAIYGSDVIANILGEVNIAQYEALCSAAMRQIEQTLAMSTYSDNLSATLTYWIDELGGKFSNLADDKDVVELAEKLSKVEEKDVVSELVKYLKK